MKGSENIFDWDRGFTLDFSLSDGFSKSAKTTKRYLSQMRKMYQDTEKTEKILLKEDPIIYEFYELGCPERKGDLSFGTTIVYPGKVGQEYYMTKGHFHSILETAEVYYTLRGHGYIMMENPEGNSQELPMEKGKALYIPRCYAHRTVNTGQEPLIFFYVFGADSGHDYGTIETRGFRKILVEENGRPVIADNPRWNINHPNASGTTAGGSQIKDDTMSFVG